MKLIIFDILGREVATLFNEQLKPGTYQVDFPARTGGDGSSSASGVYYYRLIVSGAKRVPSGSSQADYTETKRMILLK